MCEYSHTTLASLMNGRESMYPYNRARSTLLKARSVRGDTSDVSLIKFRGGYTEENEVSNNQIIAKSSKKKE